MATTWASGSVSPSGSSRMRASSGRPQRWIVTPSSFGRRLAATRTTRPWPTRMAPDRAARAVDGRSGGSGGGVDHRVDVGGLGVDEARAVRSRRSSADERYGALWVCELLRDDELGIERRPRRRSPRGSGGGSPRGGRTGRSRRRRTGCRSGASSSAMTETRSGCQISRIGAFAPPSELGWPSGGSDVAAAKPGRRERGHRRTVG